MFGALSTCGFFFSSKNILCQVRSWWSFLDKFCQLKTYIERPYLRSIANKHGQDEKRKYIDRCRLLSNSNDFNVIVSCVFLWTFSEEPYYNETLTSKTKNSPWQYIGIDVVNVLKNSLNMLNKHGLSYSWNPELQKKIIKKVYLSDAYRTTSHQIATCL